MAHFESKYLVMRDGVKIAIDLTRPESEQPVATILRLTRYHRRMKVRKPLLHPTIQAELDQHYTHRNFFVGKGYAWMDVCVRGSGASGGRRITPWSEDEVEDSREILDWIISQSWSNGKVGARGVSYDGTAAEFLLTLDHPGLKAIAPRFALFDVYADIAFPGGIPFTGFTKPWSAFNAALDRNRFDEVMTLLLSLSKPAREQLSNSPFKRSGDKPAAVAMGSTRLISKLLSMLVLGVAPVDDDPNAKILKKHIRERTQNMDVHAASEGMLFRDEEGMVKEFPEKTIDDFSPHQFADKVANPPAILNYGGWFDSAYARSAIKRFLTYEHAPHTRLIIGPWKHGTQQNISAWNANRHSTFSHEEEMLAFFDNHLRDIKTSQKKVKYFTIGEEKWKESDIWPPLGFENKRWFFHPDGELRTKNVKGEKVLLVEGKHHSGKAGRWATLLPILSHIHYLRQSSPNLISFLSSPMEKEVEITGHPLVHIEFTSTTDDPRIFVYLEDVSPSGQTYYLSEGHFRAKHRREKKSKPASHSSIPFHSFKQKDEKSAKAGTKIVMNFDLLPLSYLLKKGHFIRVSFSGCDAQNFEIGPSGKHRINLEKTWIDLPSR